MVQAVQPKANGNPSAFLEQIYLVYRKHADLNAQTPENVRMVNMAFIFQSAPDIRKKP